MAITMQTEKRDGGVVVLRLNGRLDAASTEEFEAVLMPLAEDPEVKRLILACAGLEFTASAGLRVLIKGIKAMSPRKAGFFAAEIRDEVIQKENGQNHSVEGEVTHIM